MTFLLIKYTQKNIGIWRLVAEVRRGLFTHSPFASPQLQRSRVRIEHKQWLVRTRTGLRLLHNRGDAVVSTGVSNNVQNAISKQKHAGKNTPGKPEEAENRQAIVKMRVKFAVSQHIQNVENTTNKCSPEETEEPGSLAAFCTIEATRENKRHLERKYN